MRNYAYASLAAVLLLAGAVLGLVWWSGGEERPGILPTGRAGDASTASTSDPPATDGGPDGAGRGDDPGPRPPRVRDVPDASVVDPDLEPDPGPPPPLPDGDSRVTFSVEDLEGHPIEGASITVRSGRAAEEVGTDLRGEAIFEGLADGYYSFVVDSAERPRLASVQPLELLAGDDVLVPLTLPDFDGSIAGRVRDEDGAPVPGIVVTALPLLLEADVSDLVASRDEEPSGVSDEEGRYEITGLREGEYEIRTTATEEWPVVKDRVRAGVDSADLILRRTRDIHITGHVTDADRAPIADVRVVPVGQLSHTVTTDEEGAYDLVLTVVESQELYTIRFLRGEYRESRVEIRPSDIEGDEEVLDVELAPVKGLTFVEGRVVGDDGVPVAGEVVHLQSPLLKSRYEATTNDEGEFVLEDVQSALDYRLWIRPEGYWQDFTKKGLHVPIEGAFVEVTLERLGIAYLRGRIVDTEGAPVPRFSMWMRSQNAAGRSVEITSDSDGRFTVEETPEGPLVFETKSHPRMTVTGHKVRADAEEDVEIVVDWGGYELSGRVSDLTGAPLVGTRVYLTWVHREGKVASGSTRYAVTDDSGRFVFTQLGPGSHRLNVSSPGYRPDKQAVEIGPGTPHVDVSLRPISP